MSMVKVKYHKMMLKYFLILYKSSIDKKLRANFSNKIDYHEAQIQKFSSKLTR